MRAFPTTANKGQSSCSGHLHVKILKREKEK